MTTPTEHWEQAVFFAELHRLAARHPAVGLAFAIPNAARRSYAVANRMRAEGLRAGVPDVCLPVVTEDSPGLWIEFKRTAGPGQSPGCVTPEQRRWHDALRAQGYRVEVCYGHDEGIAVVRDYLGISQAQEA